MRMRALKSSPTWAAGLNAMAAERAALGGVAG